MNTIKTAWLFPDTLYLHGERGNILALERFAKMYGLNAQTDKIDFESTDFDPMDYDVIFCPPGEITSFPVILEYLRPLRESFKEYVNAGRPLIATGTSIALWCDTVKRTDGAVIDGLSILSVDVQENEAVYGDDIFFKCSYNGADLEIIGNQIQMVDFVNKGEETFGDLTYGYGNTGKDTGEGFKKVNSVFTNSLGPVLVTNPWLTAEIIRVAAANRGIALPESGFDFSLEKKSFETKKNFIMKKESRLTNCKRNA